MRDQVSLIIPGYNNLLHFKNAYDSLQKHAEGVELILLDDASVDGTWDWMKDLDCITYHSEERVGHTILYDKGIEMATRPIVGILHADMIVGPNYIENMVKHLTKGKVVCATRVEPPIHPEGKEKIIKNFGLDFDDLDVKGFEDFSLSAQQEYKDQTTSGIFAPWILYKEDFQAIGGHDPLFAPFGYEDSDIFNRWILNGYEMVQSRDAFVYHLTCRGHRWNKGVGIENNDYQEIMERCRINYLKKWGAWVQNDQYQHPIIPPVYKKSIVIKNSTTELKEGLAPWFNGGSDIVVEIDAKTFTQQDLNVVMHLNGIVKDSGEIGQFQIGNVKVTINSMKEYQNELIKV